MVTISETVPTEGVSQVVVVKPDPSTRDASAAAAPPPLSSGGGGDDADADDGALKGEQAEVEPVPFSKLFVFADRHDWLFVFLGTLGAAALGAALPLLILVFGDLVNAFGNDESFSFDKEETQNISYRLLYIAAGALVTGFCALFFWTKVGESLTTKFRKRYIEAALRQELAYFDSSVTSGEIMSRLATDTDLIQTALSDKMANFIQEHVTAIAGLVVGMTKNWEVSLLVLGCTPLLVVAGFLLMRSLKAGDSAEQAAYTKAGTLASEVLSSIKTVYSFNGSRRAHNQFGELTRDAKAAGVRSSISLGLTTGLTFFIAYGVYALGMWFGGQIVDMGRGNGGDVISAFFSVLIAGFSLGRVTPTYKNFAEGQMAAARVLSLINRQSKIDPLSEEGLRPKECKGSIELESVHFCYPSRPEQEVLQGLSMRIEAGTSMAIVGHSGSGKSTVISLLERFYDPQQGSVRVDGHDLRQLNLRWLRGNIGLVSQEPVLFSTSIVDNIRTGDPSATQEQVEAAARAANAHGFISALPEGYNTLVGEKGARLSGGQKQRVAIARAMLRNPRILLLDEATSALDVESEQHVQAALDTLMVGRTSVIVAHRLSTVKDADCISVMERGCLLEQGTHEQLVQVEGGAYRSLMEIQLNAAAASAEANGAAEEDELSRLKSIAEDKQLSSYSDGGQADEVRASKQPSAGDIEQGLGEGKQAEGEGDPAEDGEEQGKPDASLRKLYQFTSASDKVLLSGGVACAAGNGLKEPLIALALAEILTVYFETDPDELKDGVAKWSLIFLAIAAGSFVVIFFQFYLIGTVGTNITMRARTAMFESLVRQEVAYYDKKQNMSGALCARLASDTSKIKALLTDRIAILAQSLAAMIGGLVIAFTAAWQLTLIALGLLPLLVAGFGFQLAVLKGFNIDAEYQKASQVFSEAVSNVRLVASFSAEGQMQELYAEALVPAIRKSDKRAVVSGVGYGFTQSMLFVVDFVLFFVGAEFVASDTMSFRDLFTVFFAILFAASGIGNAQAAAPDVAGASSSADSVIGTIERVPQIDALGEGGDRPRECRGRIEFASVCFAYPSRPDVNVFRSFSLVVKPGTSLALVGESGSGKSTAISLVERYYDPLAGQVLLDGHSLQQLNIQWLRSQIGLVGQEPVLFGGSIADNIRYGKPDATQAQIEAAARAANAHNFITGLPGGYDTPVGERGAQLSGGQKQRIAIARAVIKDPPCMLLDEATSALDAESEALVQAALDSLMHNRTTLIVAHRLATVRNADTIAVLQRGELVESGSHAELLRAPSGIYSNFVRLQSVRSSGSLAGSGSQPNSQAPSRETSATNLTGLDAGALSEDSSAKI